MATTTIFIPVFIFNIVFVILRSISIIASGKMRHRSRYFKIHILIIAAITMALLILIASSIYVLYEENIYWFAFLVVALEFGSCVYFEIFVLFVWHNHLPLVLTLVHSQSPNQFQTAQMNPIQNLEQGKQQEQKPNELQEVTVVDKSNQTPTTQSQTEQLTPEKKEEQ